MSNFRELVGLAVPAFALTREALNQAVSAANQWLARSGEPADKETSP